MIPLFESHIQEIPLLFRGKVRDVYDLGDHLMLVTTDRLSAFDVVLPDPIPYKGEVLHQITEHWLKILNIPSHHSTLKLEDVIKSASDRQILQGRTALVKKAKPLPIECVVRGYLLGSGYKDYLQTQSVCGYKLPAGLKLAQKLPEVLFTPSTKALVGQHDENIPFSKAIDLIGSELALQVKELSISIFNKANELAEQKGFIIADTKFEFGLVNDQLVIIDEVLTPDSSRYWLEAEYKVGTSPKSYDKQIVRDYLVALNWNQKPPAPSLPAKIIQKTSQKYLALKEKLLD